MATMEEMQAELDRLRRENEDLKTVVKRVETIKVSGVAPISSLASLRYGRRSGRFEPTGR